MGAFEVLPLGCLSSGSRFRRWRGWGGGISECSGGRQNGQRESDLRIKILTVNWVSLEQKEGSPQEVLPCGPQTLAKGR